MKNSKSAFTMIELIFVIIIIGVLASVAVAKFGSMTQTADIASARSDIAAIRSAIITERQRSLVRGNASYITKLTPGAGSATLFTGDGGVGGNAARTLLMYGLEKGTGAGQWERVTDTGYIFHSGNDNTTFIYTPLDGRFDCTVGANECNKLAN